MSDTSVTLCDRCQSVLGESAAQLRFESGPSSVDRAPMKLCRHCTESFENWVLRRGRQGRRRGSSRSSEMEERDETSPSPAVSESHRSSSVGESHRSSSVGESHRSSSVGESHRSSSGRDSRFSSSERSRHRSTPAPVVEPPAVERPVQAYVPPTPSLPQEPARVYQAAAAAPAPAALSEADTAKAQSDKVQAIITISVVVAMVVIMLCLAVAMVRF